MMIYPIQNNIHHPQKSSGIGMTLQQYVRRCDSALDSYSYDESCLFGQLIADPNKIDIQNFEIRETDEDNYDEAGSPINKSKNTNKQKLDNMQPILPSFHIRKTSVVGLKEELNKSRLQSKRRSMQSKSSFSLKMKTNLFQNEPFEGTGKQQISMRKSLLTTKNWLTPIVTIKTSQLNEKINMFRTSTLKMKKPYADFQKKIQVIL